MPDSRVEDIETTAVIGAGQMGREIAAVQSLAGYEVTLQDIDADQLEEAQEHVAWSYQKSVEHGNITDEKADAALSRLEWTDAVEEATADVDFVTEAVVEQLSIKAGIFETLDEVTPEHAILATNTSGLNVTKLAETTDRPDRVVGTHWFNPPMLMDLVEVVITEHTADSVADTCEALIEQWDKTPIRCKRDVPNFIVNRLMRPYGESACWLVHYGEAEIDEIDSAMKYREDFPMGPFELADYTGGIQIRVEGEQDHLTDPRPLAYDTKISPLAHELYEAGRYGRKSGRGFYDYSDQDQPNIPEEAGRDFDVMLVWAPVINEAVKMVQHDVATVEDIDTGAKLGGNWPLGPLEKADEVGLQRIVEGSIQVSNYHASDHELNKAVETLPCDFLIEKAKAGETFY